ncbi:MAG: hypothetical protein JKY93_07580 [Gammaproteobacteria bacterium]|nr:hypothetical protein [Gammaproteobacteria bacterium]
MRNAMQNQCTGSQPVPFNPIKNETPPYGNGPMLSKDLNVDSLKNKLLLGQALEQLIDHIDVWGEGRKDDHGLRTGFPAAFNINLNQGIGPTGYQYADHAIPNLLPVCTYSDTFDVIPDKSVKTITIMGSPIIETVANEIARIVADSGAVLTFGYKYHDNDIKTLMESLNGRAFIKDISYKLGSNYTAISLEPVIVFSSKSNPDPYIHDEL